MSIHKPSKTPIHAPLGDERLHIDSGMPDKRPLSASGAGHADTDFPDQEYTAGKRASSFKQQQRQLANNPGVPEMRQMSFLHHIFN
jgi:hypothetical protein